MGGRFSLIFYIISIATLIIFRSLSLYADSFNPDEGMHLANAISLMYDNRLWVSTDTTTFGPVNALMILFVHKVVSIFFKSIGLSYFLLRLINIVIISVSFILLSKIFEYRLGKKIGKILSLFYVLFFSFEYNFDLQAFNSEYTFILFVSISLYFYLYKFQKGEGNIGALLLGSFFCGIMPYIKLQTIPMCMVIFFWGIFLILSEDSIFVKIHKKKMQKVPALIIYLGVVGLPSILLFIYLLIEGSIDNFWFYYISNAKAHIGSHSVGSYINFFILDLVPFFLSLRWYDSIFIISLISFLFAIKSYLVKKDIHRNWSFACIFLFTGIWAITQPKSLFTHYLLFLVVPALIFVSETLVILNEGFFKPLKFNGINIPKKVQRLLTKENTVMSIGICIIILLFGSFYENVSTQTILSTKSVIGSSNSPLVQLAQYVEENTDENDSVVVWGWEQRVLVFSNRKSGTAQTDIQRLYPPYSEKNIDMYIADIYKNKPKLIVDVVTNGSFGYSNNDTNGLEKHERVWSAIKNDYEFSDTLTSGDSTYRIYLRKV